jgi:hypothetical protein
LSCPNKMNLSRGTSLPVSLHHQQLAISWTWYPAKPYGHHTTSSSLSSHQTPQTEINWWFGTATRKRNACTLKAWNFICNQHAKYSPDITPSNMWIFYKGGLAKWAKPVALILKLATKAHSVLNSVQYKSFIMLCTR